MVSVAAFLVPPNVISGPSSVSALRLTSPLLLAQEKTESIITVATTTTFDPIVPDGSALLGMISIVLLSGLAFYVWQEQVVPVSRTNLALSKRNGAVKQYLDELAAVEDGANMTAAAADDGSDTTVSNRKFETWLFTDWLIQRERRSTGQSTTIRKEPALPILKNAKWNSGDNPIIAATGLIGLCVLMASLTERVFQ